MTDISTMSLAALFKRLDEVHNEIGEAIFAYATAKAHLNELASEQERLLTDLSRKMTTQSGRD